MTELDSRIMYGLKEKAKWSDDKLEKKQAIKELAAYGSEAIPALDEIFMVTISDDIQVACVDVINAIKENITAKSEIASTVPEKAAEA